MVMRCSLFCPQCYSNRRGRSNYKGHWGYRKSPNDNEVSVMTILRKAAANGGTFPAPGFWVGADGVELMPALQEFLTLEAWEDGSVRLTGTAILFLDGRHVKCLLNDKENNRVAVVSGASAYSALENAEEGLTLETLDWRRSKEAAGGRQSKK